MSLRLNDLVSNIFYADRQNKEAQKQKTASLQRTANNVFGTNQRVGVNTLNPLVRRNGELLNPRLNYQLLLNSPKVSQKFKNYITQATGLTPTVTFNNQRQATETPSVQTQVSKTPKATITPTGSTTPTGNTIADSAQKYIGTPYVWGGESMEEGGMDCSGFVYNALKDAGYNVGRTTAQGYRNQGTTVNKADMQPGDLIFYGKNGEASHIGIYIGNGQVIHSSGGSKNTKANPGKGVTVTNVDHRSDFIEARRY